MATHSYDDDFEVDDNPTTNTNTSASRHTSNKKATAPKQHMATTAAPPPSMLRIFGPYGSEPELYGAPYHRRTEGRKQPVEVEKEPESRVLSEEKLPQKGSGKKHKKRTTQQHHPQHQQLRQRPSLHARSTTLTATTLASSAATHQFEHITKLVAIIDEQKARIAALVEADKTAKIINKRQEKAIQQLSRQQTDFPTVLKALNDEIRGLKSERHRAKQALAQATHSAAQQLEENVRLRGLLAEKSIHRGGKDSPHKAKLVKKQDGSEVVHPESKEAKSQKARQNRPTAKNKESPTSHSAARPKPESSRHVSGSSNDINNTTQPAPIQSQKTEKGTGKPPHRPVLVEPQRAEPLTTRSRAAEPTKAPKPAPHIDTQDDDIADDTLQAEDKEDEPVPDQVPDDTTEDQYADDYDDEFETASDTAIDPTHAAYAISSSSDESDNETADTDAPIDSLVPTAHEVAFLKRMGVEVQGDTPISVADATTTSHTNATPTAATNQRTVAQAAETSGEPDAAFRSKNLNVQEKSTIHKPNLFAREEPHHNRDSEQQVVKPSQPGPLKPNFVTKDARESPVMSNQQQNQPQSTQPLQATPQNSTAAFNSTPKHKLDFLPPQTQQQHQKTSTAATYTTDSAPHKLDFLGLPKAAPVAGGYLPSTFAAGGKKGDSTDPEGGNKQQYAMWLRGGA